MQQIKCDRCKQVKAEGLQSRLIILDSEGNSYGRHEVGRFVADLCDACESKLVDAMQKFLRCKPTTKVE